MQRVLHNSFSTTMEVKLYLDELIREGWHIDTFSCVLTPGLANGYTCIVVVSKND